MCSENPTNQNEKLMEVLRLLMLPDCTIASTNYLDDLISHITKNISSGCPVNSEGIDKSSLQKWVLEALESWSAGPKPCPVVATFTLKLIGLMGSDELDFLFWYRADIFTKLRTVFALEDSDVPASIKMAYSSMLLEFLNHNNGRRWIRESGSWVEVIKFCHTNDTPYATRESQEFIWKLLLFEAGDAEFCEEVISVAAKPLINNTLIPQPYSTLENSDSDQNEHLLNVIDLLTVILENTLFASMDNTIPHPLKSVTILECGIKELFEACIGTKFLERIMKFMYLLIIAGLKSVINGSGEKIDQEHIDTFRRDLRYIDSALLSKKAVLDMIKGRKLFMIYWQRMNTLCKIEMPDEYKLEDQCIINMLVPLSFCMPLKRTEEDIFEIFIHKLFNLACMYTQRLFYAIRDILRKEDPLIENICEICVQTAMDVIDIIDRDNTVIIFQALSYLLRDFVSFSNIKSDKQVDLVKMDKLRISQIQESPDFDPIVQFPNLLSVILDGVSTIIHKFKLKWPECLETTRILYFAQNILSHPNVLPKLCVQALSLCELAIQNFMAPNLALLMQPDSRANEMGPVLYKRMHDPNWEVRDSALEVINTIATISEDKYPAFQDLLLENEFPQATVHIAATDGESKVRATALRCTATLVRINRIWNEKLCYSDLPKMAIKLITKESEGIVRKEAVKLVKELYVHRKWPKSVIEDMVKTMSAAAVSDLHWEVKVCALEFWSQFSKTQFSDQGMLDGIFPTVTFSKEHRKIVSLNDDEIRKRILKALDELVKHNCLGVLFAALEDDSNVQVCKASGEIIRKFQNVFVQYKIKESAMEFSSLKGMNVRNVSSSVRKDNKNLFSNQIETLESVVIHPLMANTDDINLLASMYDHTLKISSTPESKYGENVEYIPQVDKYQFVRSVLEYDFVAHIEEKNCSLNPHTNSSGSVFDKILTALQDRSLPT